MKHLLTILLALTCFTANAATVTGNLIDLFGENAGGTITFSNTLGAQIIGTTINVSKPKSVALTSGAFTNVLVTGNYLVTAGGHQFRINVPDSTNTYRIETLSTNLPTYTYTNQPVFALAAGTNVTTLTNGGLVTISSTGGGGDLSNATNNDVVVSNAVITYSRSTVGTGATNLNTASSNALRTDITANTTSIANKVDINTTANSLYVSKSGSDGTGTRGRIDKPFLTINAAKNVAQAGDTIFVGPGLYNENNLLTNGVNYILDGVTLYWMMTDATATGSRGIFDDRWTGPTTNSITGNFDIICSNGTNYIVDDIHAPTSAGSTQSFGGIVITNATTYFNIEGRRFFTENYAVTYAAICAVNGESHFKFDSLTPIRDTLSTPYTIEGEEASQELSQQGSGVLWILGELYVDIKHIGRVGQYSFWPEEPAGLHTNNMWVNCELVEAKIYNLASSPTYRSWYNIKELKTVEENGAALDIYGGAVYYKGDKISDTRAAGINIGSIAGNTKAWIEVQKVGTKSLGLTVNASGGKTTEAYVNIMHFEDNGGATNFIAVNGGSAWIEGQYGLMTNGGCVYHTGGNATIKGYTFDTRTTDSATKRPVTVTANGLRLQDCILLAPTSANSIYAPTAKNVGIYGHVMGSKTNSPNITLTPLGAFTVDANLP